MALWHVVEEPAHGNAKQQRALPHTWSRMNMMSRDSVITLPSSSITGSRPWGTCKGCL
jgi:hypothetical protein